MCEQRGRMRTVLIRDHVLRKCSLFLRLILYSQENLIQVERDKKCIRIPYKNRQRQPHPARREVTQRGRLRTVLVHDPVLKVDSLFRSLVLYKRKNLM